MEAATKEWECLRQFLHPNVIYVLDFAMGYGLFVIIFSALDKDLDQFIKTEIYYTTTVAEIIRQLLRGVNHIHNLGFLINDIKAANVAVSYDKGAQGEIQLELRVIDLGSAMRIVAIKPGDIMRFTKECQSPDKKLGMIHLPSDIFEAGSLIREVIKCSQDKEQSDRTFGELVQAMTSVDFARRPTAWQIRRIVDAERLERWERLNSIWYSKTVFGHDILYIITLPDPLTFLARNFSDRMIFITKLARGGSLRNINKAFFFLYKTAQGQESSGQMGAGFRDRIMLQISEFHAVVGDSWWTQLLYCMTIRSLCSVLPPIALPQSVEDLLRALSSVEVCKAYVREALDLALASAAPIDAEPAAKKRKRSADTA